MTTTTVTDRIEKRVVLRAPRARVWRALTDYKEFGTWFRAKLQGPFVEGGTVHGNILYPGYEHLTLELQVERIDAERYFAYRWHPYAIDTTVDYSQEPTTLVEFTLDETADGVLLRIVESGFDAIPAHRRARAFEANSQGWAKQTELVRKYLALSEKV